MNYCLRFKRWCVLMLLNDVERLIVRNRKVKAMGIVILNRILQGLIVLHKDFVLKAVDGGMNVFGAFVEFVVDQIDKIVRILVVLDGNR